MEATASKNQGKFAQNIRSKNLSNVEAFTKNDRDTWLQTLLFDLINRRYNAKKPTIFSSNYSLNELVNLRGIADRTIDRISEMTSGAVFKFDGESMRSKF